MPPFPETIARYFESLTMASGQNVPDKTEFTKGIYERMQTFGNFWPLTYLSGKQMAEAGFSFMGKIINGKYRDDVKCFHCGLEMNNWRPGDDPLKDHKKYSNNCVFINELINIYGTIDERGYDTCGTSNVVPSDVLSFRSQIPTKDPLEKLGIQQKTVPAFPQFSNYIARRNTFDRWPATSSIHPDLLSEAGFYYTGNGDQTICFQCSGGLKDWEDNDDPWVEHARWFHNCPFVKLVKGQEFIHKVIGYKASQQDELLSFQELTSVLNAYSEVQPAPNVSEIEPSNSTGLNSSSVSKVKESPTPNAIPAPLIALESSENNPIADGRLCKICYQREIGVVFLPCGHMMACAQCVATLTVCAICRKKFTATVRAFLS